MVEILALKLSQDANRRHDDEIHLPHELLVESFGFLMTLNVNTRRLPRIRQVAKVFVHPNAEGAMVVFASIRLNLSILDVSINSARCLRRDLLSICHRSFDTVAWVPVVS